MLVHQCGTCSRISINRIARDDKTESIMAAFETSCAIIGDVSRRLIGQNISWLTYSDKAEIETRLFGKY